MPMSAVYRRIPILAAVGTGATTLSAFHAALTAVGLEGFNLLRLSSVIPPGTDVDPTGAAPIAGEWGDRLYCVYAAESTSTAGVGVWAGVGWVLRRDGTGGLFVEHVGGSRAAVVDAVEASLADMLAACPGEFCPPQWVTAGAVCAGRPVCALVIAPYETVAWRGGG